MNIYYVAGLPYSDELYHYGIKGQKWGIRRFQNLDGTRTQEGKERYSEKSKSGSELSNGYDKIKKYAKVAAVGLGAAALGYGAYKLSKSDAGREFLNNRRHNMAIVKTAKNAWKMDPEQRAKLLGELKQQKDIMETAYSLVSSSADPTTRMLKESGRKVAAAALTGVGSYSLYAVLTGKVDPKQLANYAFSNPNKKK